MSKEVKHTKTPWIYCGGDNNDNCEIEIGGTVASFTRSDKNTDKYLMSREEMEANAKLATSAPQLLEVLIKAKHAIEETAKFPYLPYLPDWVKVLLHTRLCEIETAINKATS